MMPCDYFDKLYANNTDPWHYQTRWYEQRKRAINLAVLPQAHYDYALELGCSNGVFSAVLSQRCTHLRCVDGNAQAVTLAKQRLQGLSHVVVQQAKLPHDLSELMSSHSTSQMPQEGYDLIVIGEILYYLSPQEVQAVIVWLQQALAINGTLLCCHWRFPIAGFEMTGEQVHQQLHASLDVGTSTEVAFFHQTTIHDADFILDVWERQAIEGVDKEAGNNPNSSLPDMRIPQQGKSLAQQEGLR